GRVGVHLGRLGIHLGDLGVHFLALLRRGRWFLALAWFLRLLALLLRGCLLALARLLRFRVLALFPTRPCLATTGCCRGRARCGRLRVRGGRRGALCGGVRGGGRCFLGVGWFLRLVGLLARGRLLALARLLRFRGLALVLPLALALLHLLVLIVPVGVVRPD